MRNNRKNQKIANCQEGSLCIWTWLVPWWGASTPDFLTAVVWGTALKARMRPCTRNRKLILMGNSKRISRTEMLRVAVVHLGSWWMLLCLRSRDLGHAILHVPIGSYHAATLRPPRWPTICRRTQSRGRRVWLDHAGPTSRWKGEKWSTMNTGMDPPIGFGPVFANNMTLCIHINFALIDPLVCSLDLLLR